jgi:hypothetical protein
LPIPARCKSVRPGIIQCFLNPDFPANREISRDFFSFGQETRDFCPNFTILLFEQGISRDLAGNFQLLSQAIQNQMDRNKQTICQLEAGN